MFDYSLAHWGTFFTAAVLLNISPGPDFAFILAQTAKNGRRSGFAAMFGIWSGAFLHVVFAALGLSVVLATSAGAFTVIKWIGAIYLLYLGIQALRSNGSLYSDHSSGKKVSNFKIYQQGVLVSTLNPKVAIFFLAFLPQFVVEGAGPVEAQLFLHGFLIIAVAAFIEPPLVILGEKLSRVISRDKRVSLWMDRGLGALLIGLGARLALTERA